MISSNEVDRSILDGRVKRRNSRLGRRSGRTGHTLIELLLALALSVVVMSMIALSIQVYLIALTKQQAMLERKQIARAVIAMIGNDLRAGIQYKAADYSGLENLVQTQSLMQSSAPSEDDATSEEPEDSGIIVEEDVAFSPTLIGDSSVIMIDISRLPRLDQYNPIMVSADSEVQSPSDVKSLAYFVSLNAGGVQEELEFAKPRAPGGLYRREIDRAVAAYMGDYDMIAQPDSYTKLIANEVAQMSFRYFDGEDWQDEWDSEESGGFPRAIEVIIVIDPSRSAVGADEYAYGGLDSDSMETYRTVVYLPVSDIPSEE